MAKGEQPSNREAKRPKKEKPEPAVACCSCEEAKLMAALQAP
jgi:hypothetical protein